MFRFISNNFEPSKKHMSVLFILIGTSLLVALGFLIAFIWSVKNGQYDDDYTPSVRILFENEQPEKETNTNKHNTLCK